MALKAQESHPGLFSRIAVYEPSLPGGPESTPQGHTRRHPPSRPSTYVSCRRQDDADVGRDDIEASESISFETSGDSKLRIAASLLSFSSANGARLRLSRVSQRHRFRGHSHQDLTGNRKPDVPPGTVDPHRIASQNTVPCLDRIRQTHRRSGTPTPASTFLLSSQVPPGCASCAVSPFATSLLFTDVLCRFESNGHFGPFEAPEAIAAHILQFLAGRCPTRSKL